MYCSQAQVEAYLRRNLIDAESLLFPTLEQGIEDWIDIYCGRTFTADRSVTSTVDNTVGDLSTNHFQRYDGGVDEIFFDTTLQTDTTQQDSEGNNLVTAPYIGSYDSYTGMWTLLNPTTYIFYEPNTKAKTSVQTRVGSFPYGIQNIFVYGTFGDFMEVPNAIQLAATTLCASYILNTDNLKSETIEGYARTFDKEPNPIVEKLLDTYKRVLL